MKTFPLDGCNICFTSFSITRSFDMTNISATIVYQDKEFLFCCEDVSSITFHEVSFPLYVCGLTIQDHIQDGWNPRNRYSVYDYEDDTLSFCCADYMLAEIQEDPVE